MLASELQDLIVATLARKVGGNQRRWRLALGPVRVLDGPHFPCNWSVAPSGSAGENAAIERLLDDLRLQHPTVEAG